MNIGPNTGGSVWVDMRADEVYAFAASIPDFGPKTVGISLEVDLRNGDVLRWIGVTEAHSSEGIEALGRYMWSHIPTKPANPDLAWKAGVRGAIWGAVTGAATSTAGFWLYDYIARLINH